METNNDRTKKIKVIIISGMSGTGKTHAADWFEDHGYYCIDNMPPSLIKSFLELSTFRRIKSMQAAFVVDIWSTPLQDFGKAARALPTWELARTAPSS